MSINYWKTAYKEELDHAILARSSGNEGMARVCTRREAGLVTGEYLERLGYIDITNSAYDHLTKFINLPSVNPIYKEIARHFLLKVDHDHNLPRHVDLIADVQILEKELLNEPIH